MRFLHTADWHVGKPLRGRLRMDEYAGALDQVAQVAKDRQVDAVLIAGNHDHPRKLDALATLLESLGIHVRHEVRPPDQGGVVKLASRDGKGANGGVELCDVGSLRPCRCVPPHEGREHRHPPPRSPSLAVAPLRDRSTD